MDFLEALIQDPGRLHGVSDTAPHLIQHDLTTFIWQEEIRKMSTDNAEKSYSVLQIPFLHSALVLRRGGSPVIPGPFFPVSFPQLL